MNTYNELKMLYGAYYGVSEIYEYKVKEFILKDIKKLIDEYIKKNNMYYYEEVEVEAKKQTLITDLQDSLIVLKRMDAPFELMLLIKEKIRVLKDAENRFVEY